MSTTKAIKLPVGAFAHFGQNGSMYTLVHVGDGVFAVRDGSACSGGINALPTIIQGVVDAAAVPESDIPVLTVPAIEGRNRFIWIVKGDEPCAQ